MPELRTLVFELRELTPTLNELRKMHHFEYARVRVALAWKVRAALNSVRYFAQPPMQRAAMSIARYSVGTPDQDGLTGGVKPLVDTLVLASASHPNGLGVITDDRPACLTLSVLGHKVHTLADQRTVVAIRELEPLPAEVVEKPKRVRRKARGGPDKRRVARGAAIYARAVLG